MTVWLSGNISESNVSIPNNSSDVTVNLYANWNAGSWAHDNPSGQITIDGTSYGFTSNFNPGNTTTGSQLISTQSKNVTHNADGSKTVSCSASYAGTGSYTVYWSDASALSAIPRGSVLGAVSAFNWEDAFSVPVSKYSASFTDNLTIKIGDATIKTLSNYTSGAGITLTDTELFAAYNALGTAMSAAASFLLQTYSGGSLIGSASAGATGSAVGTAYLNVGGSWKRTVPHLNAGGTWKKSIAYTNSGGVWKRCAG